MSTKLRMRLAISALVVSFTAAGCADVGPFRAGGDHADAGADDPDGMPGNDAPPDGSGTVDTPHKLTGVTGRPDQLAVTDGYVYWNDLEGATLQRIAKAGGAVASLSTGAAVAQLGARGTDVYWMTSSELRSTTDSGFTASPVLASATRLFSFAVAPAHVYLGREGTTGSGSTLERVPRTGGAVEPLRANLGTPPLLATTDTALYSAIFVSTSIHIDRASLTSPTTTTTLGTAPNLGKLEAFGDRACWSFMPDPNVQANEIWCYAQGAKRRIATGLYDVLGLAVTPAAVYYVERDYPSTFRVRRFDTATQTTTDVRGPSTRLAVSLATDQTSLYWFEGPGADATELWTVRLP